MGLLQEDIQFPLRATGVFVAELLQVCAVPFILMYQLFRWHGHGEALPGSGMDDALPVLQEKKTSSDSPIMGSTRGAALAVFFHRFKADHAKALQWYPFNPEALEHEQRPSGLFEHDCVDFFCDIVCPSEGEDIFDKVPKIPNVSGGRFSLLRPLATATLAVLNSFILPLLHILLKEIFRLAFYIISMSLMMALKANRPWVYLVTNIAIFIIGAALIRCGYHEWPAVAAAYVIAGIELGLYEWIDRRHHAFYWQALSLTLPMAALTLLYLLPSHFLHVNTFWIYPTLGLLLGFTLSFQYEHSGTWLGQTMAFLLAVACFSQLTHLAHLVDLGSWQPLWLAGTAACTTVVGLIPCAIFGEKLANMIRSKICRSCS